MLRAGPHRASADRMAYAIAPSCIGCGACELVCPKGAISQGAGYTVLYEVDSLACNDCDRCVAVCPVDALAPEPHWAACHGRGCPLSSRRYASWQCNEGDTRCIDCSGPLWRSADGVVSCPACGGARAGGGRGAACPKPRQKLRLQQSADLTRVPTGSPHPPEPGMAVPRQLFEHSL